MIIISEVKVKSKISSSPSTLPRRRQRQYFVSFDKIYSSIFTCSLQDKLLLIVDLPGRSSTSPCSPLTDSPRTPWPRCSPRRPAGQTGTWARRSPGCSTRSCWPILSPSLTWVSQRRGIKKSSRIHLSIHRARSLHLSK